MYSITHPVFIGDYLSLLMVCYIKSHPTGTKDHWVKLYLKKKRILNKLKINETKKLKSI